MGVVVNIYCIEDCYGEKYIGSTRQTLRKRHSEHKSDKEGRKKNCSSSRLDLTNSEIWLLEKCSEDQRKEKEQYYIDNIECVNKINVNKNICKMNLKKYMKEHYKKNKEQRLKKQKEYDEKKYNYQISWGGRIYSNDNSLLKISLDVFS